MVIQYLIDWENLIPDTSGNCSERLCVQLLRLMAAVRRNGVLVNSNYVEQVISRRYSIDNNRLIDRVLDEVISVYRDFGERVDSIENPANNLNETIELWGLYLTATGVSISSGDVRFVVVGAAGGIDGDFYCCNSLEDALEIGDPWTRLLHFPRGRHLNFRKYIEAFFAAAVENVRIYDPYLSSAFKSVERARCVKAWRNSLYYILRVILRNNHIKIIDVITTDHIETYRVNEIIADIIRPCSASRDEGNIAELAFHFVDSRRSFHDRFLSNGRFCFAIGHGCDVCEVDDAYQEIEERARKGEHIFGMQWRNMPHQGTEVFSDFNVFYGCSRNNVPNGVPVFMERRVDEQGESIIYPSECRARRLEDIRTRIDNNGNVVNRFVGIPENPQNPVFSNNRVAVSINPLTLVEDF